MKGIFIIILFLFGANISTAQKSLCTINKLTRTGSLSSTQSASYWLNSFQYDKAEVCFRMTGGTTSAVANIFVAGVKYNKKEILLEKSGSAFPIKRIPLSFVKNKDIEVVITSKTAKPNFMFKVTVDGITHNLLQGGKVVQNPKTGYKNYGIAGILSHNQKKKLAVQGSCSSKVVVRIHKLVGEGTVSYKVYEKQANGTYKSLSVSGGRLRLDIGKSRDKLFISSNKELKIEMTGSTPSHKVEYFARAYADYN